MTFKVRIPPLFPQGQAGTSHYLVEAKLAALNKQFKQAEAILLERVRTHHLLFMSLLSMLLSSLTNQFNMPNVPLALFSPLTLSLYSPNNVLAPYTVCRVK